MPPHVFETKSNLILVRLVAGDTEVISVGSTLSKRRLEDGALLAEARCGERATAAAISPDRTRLAIVTKNAIEVRDTDLKLLASTQPRQDHICAASIAPSGDVLAVRYQYGKRIGIYRLPDLALVTEFPLEDSGRYCEFLGDGCVAVSTRTGIYFYDIATGLQSSPLELDEAEFTNCEGFHRHDGIVSIIRSLDCYQFDAATGRRLRKFTSDFSLSYSELIAHPQYWVFGDISGDIDIFESSASQSMRRAKGHSEPVSSLDLSQDGRWLLSADENEVRVWDLPRLVSDPSAYTLSGDESFSFEFRHAAGLHFTPDGKLLAARRGAVQFFSVPEFRELATIPIVPGQGQLQFIGDRNAFGALWTEEFETTLENGVESSNQVFSARLFDLTSGAEQAKVQLPIRYPSYAKLNAAQTQLAAFGSEHLYLIDFKSGAILHQLACHSGYIEDSRFSGLRFKSDGRLLTSARDNSLCEWNPDTGKLLRTYAGDGAKSIESFQLSPDNTLLAVSQDQAIVILNAATWQVVQTIPQSTRVHWSSMAFTPDNSLLAFTSTHHQTILLYSMKSGELIAELAGHTSGVTGVCFSADGAWMASASDDVTLKVWSVAKCGK